VPLDRSSAGDMIAGVGKVMKRRLVKKSWAILVVIGFLLVSLAVLMLDTGPVMSFDFLKGMTLAARTGTESGKSTRYVYSFKGDFDTVSTKVNAELSKLDFRRSMLGNKVDKHIHEYRRRNHGTNDSVKITILKRNVPTSHSTSKTSQDSDPDRNIKSFPDGWITIEISRSRQRSWSPRYILYRLRLKLRRIINKQSPNKQQTITGVN
jgi:hypothetical protein